MWYGVWGYSDPVMRRSTLREFSCPERVVILGMAPNEPGPAFAPSQPSGQRMLALAGPLLARATLHNLVDEPFRARASLHEIRRVLRFASLEYRFRTDRRYVLVGAEVARAFGTRAVPHDARSRDERPILTWFLSRGGIWMSLLPHPSGRNRWYNAPGNRMAAQAFLRSALAPETYHQLHA